VALVLDPAGKPVIVYPDAGVNHLRRARPSGSTWTTDTIYTAPAGGGNFREPAALMTSSGELDVVFGAAFLGDPGIRTILVRGTTGSWSATSVTTGDSIHISPAIARATDGTIWLTEWTSDSVVTVHRRSPAGTWTDTPLTSTFGASWPTVAVDMSGLVHVAYAVGAFYGSSGCTIPECPGGPGIRHAAFDGSGWTTTKLSALPGDALPMVMSGADGSVTVVFMRFGSGLRALELVPGKPAPTIQLQAASDTGSSQTDHLTNATTLTFDLTFDRPVTGLTAADLTRTGTATGCVLQPVAGSGAAYTISVTGCSAGTVVLSMKAGAVSDGSLSGPAVATSGPSVTIDRTAPTVGAPTVTFRTSTSLVGSTMPIRLSWTAGDTGGSGVGSSSVSRSLDGGATWTTLASGIAGSTDDLTVSSSGTVRFRIRTVDRAGNPRTGSATAVLTPRLIQQTTSAITYRGSWGTSTSASFSGGTARASSKAGSSASYRFTGRAVAVVSTRAATRGQVRVYVDGALVATVDCRSSTTQYRSVVWQRRWTSSGTHTIKLVVVGTSGRPRFDLDAIEVLR
jgi:hypothetical protein